MKPYWDRDGITIYHASCEAVIAAGLLPVPEVAFIEADPPYGVKENTDRSTRQRGKRRVGSTDLHAGDLKGKAWPPIIGDDKPYDPALLLALDRPMALWGANHYASQVPASPSWVVWDKRDKINSNDNADGELAWTNLGGPLRIFRHLWNGTCRASETGVPHLGPTQKPSALAAYMFRRAKLKPGDLVFVPYLGTGSELPAALAMGLRVIGCDIDKYWCKVAVSRLGVVAAPEPTTDMGPLFARATT